MSVLIKRIDSSSGGGSSKGYPPGNVTDVTIKGGNKKVTIKWTDPDDVVIGDKTLSTWQSTTLVRKKGSAPTSIKDGNVLLTNTVRNEYKYTEYTDNNLDPGTYYYRFFTCSTENVYNDSSSMIYSATTTTIDFDPILRNNTWEQINAASEAGVASDIWNIGDEIDITLSGTYNETVTLQIWDFNHFDKSDDTGKAGICFGMKNLMKMKDDMYRFDGGGGFYGDWNNSYIRNTTMQNVYNSMPHDLQSVIKISKVYTAEQDAPTSIGDLTLDRVFLPGCTEVMGSSYSYTQYNAESNQVQFPIFTNNNSRINRLKNGSGVANAWWTRSPDENSQNFFVVIRSKGDTTGYDIYEAESCGICFCFNV